MAEIKNEQALNVSGQEYSDLFNQVMGLQNEYNNVHGQIQDTLASIEAVKAFKDINDGEREGSLVSLAPGIYVKADICKSDKLFLNVGAKAIVVKRPDETIKLLEAKKEELLQYATNVKLAINQTTLKLEELKREIDNLR
jgi:prefoldin alpha subunit